MRDLLKRSVVALSALASNESADVCERLTDFKNSVQKGTAIEEIEESLRALRDTIVKSEQLLAGGTGRRSEPDARGAVNKLGAQAPIGDSNGHGKVLQSIFVGLIAELDQDFGEDYSLRLTKLRDKIEQSTQIADIVGFKDDIILLVQAYNQMINEERNLVTEFNRRLAQVYWR